MKNLALICCAMALLLVIPGLSMGKEEEGASRELSVSKTDKSAVVTSYPDTAPSPFFQISVSSSKDLVIVLRYGGIDGGNGTGISVKFLGLVEYAESDGNEGFEPFGDSLQSYYPLSNSFYESDLFMGRGSYEGETWSKEIHPVLPKQSYSVYVGEFDKWFGAGFDRGYEVGASDFEAGRPKIPDISKNGDPIATELLGLLDSYIDSVNANLSNDKSLLSVIDEASHKGASNGFSMGYSKGYSPQTRSGTENVTLDDVRYDPYRNATAGNESVPLSDLSIFGDLIVSGSEDLIRISLRTLDGIFSLECAISSIPTTVEGNFLFPASVKFSVRISDYPYNSSGTSIALLLDVGVISPDVVPMDTRYGPSYEQERGLTADESGLSFRSSEREFDAFFSWTNVSVCDGATERVIVNDFPSLFGSAWSGDGISGENFIGLAFTYPGADLIIHDPKIGLVEVGGIPLYDTISMPLVSERIFHGSVWIYLATSFVTLTIIAAVWKARTTGR